jgi:hypothetical protein
VRSIYISKLPPYDFAIEIARVPPPAPTTSLSDDIGDPSREKDTPVSFSISVSEGGGDGMGEGGENEEE